MGPPSFLLKYLEAYARTAGRWLHGQFTAATFRASSSACVFTGAQHLRSGNTGQ